MQPVTIDTFGGLDLINDPEEVGAERAVNLLDVDVDERGRLRSRPGTAAFLTQASYNPTAIAVLPSENEVLVSWAGATPNVKAYNSAGTEQASVNFVAGNFTVIGTPTASYVYFGSGSVLERYDGTAFAASAGQPGFLVATTLNDNRLVTARTVTNPSRVYFSNPGDPETFGANNYVDLHPGDGEVITALVTWREYLFVFKRSRIFVFYGTSIDSTGNPIFNYRTIDTGLGATGQFTAGSLSQVAAACAARDGVYFVADDGVYRTTGGVPEKVSRRLDPWFDGKTLPLATSLPTYAGAFSAPTISADSKRVYVRPEGTKTFVYGLDTGEWTVYSLAVLAGCSYPTSNTAKREMLLGLAGKVVKHYETYTTDEGSAISSSYQSGFYDLGSPNEKRIKRTKLWGVGSPTLSVFTDHGSTDANAAAVTLGTSPAVAEGTRRHGRKGVFFSHKLSASSAWTLHRVTHHVAAERLVGSRS